MKRRVRERLLPAIGAVALLLSVSACSSGAAECEEAFAAAATSVPGVVSAKWDCSEQFGGGWQRADVVIDATSKEEAVAVMDEVLRAIAAAPDLEDTWSTPQEYWNEDRSVGVGPNELGFNGPPNVGEVREHYGITPG
ncbi:hypothetical protein [Promicromonospora sp. NPDC060271]|uniref:hypothetical protein n=1 Tax=Promicromonospora sp. NPDC060271 TaxID=3347089 RepID=UPI003665B68C